MLTVENRANLEKLATYLEGLPPNYRHFDMGLFIRGVKDGEKIARYALRNGGVARCGTAACAAGHGPAAGILFPVELVMGSNLNWIGYCDLFTGGSGSLYNWLFSGKWDIVDNSHYGAAARIRYLLARGRPPETFARFPCETDKKAYAPYRIDAPASADRSPEGGDALAAPSRSDESAVGEAETPNP